MRIAATETRWNIQLQFQTVDRGVVPEATIIPATINIDSFVPANLTSQGFPCLQLSSGLHVMPQF